MLNGNTSDRFGRTRNAFSSSQKFHEYFYNSIETLRKCFLSLLEKLDVKKAKALLTLVIKMHILLARAIITSTARANSVIPSSFNIPVNLLALYQKWRSLIGYATHYLFYDR